MGVIYMCGKNPGRRPSARPSAPCHAASSPFTQVAGHHTFVNALRPHTFHFAHVLRDHDTGWTAGHDVEHDKYLDRVLASIEGQVSGSRLLEAEYAAFCDLIDRLPGRWMPAQPTVLGPPPDAPSTMPLPTQFEPGTHLKQNAARLIATLAQRHMGGSATLLTMAMQFLSSAEQDSKADVPEQAIGLTADRGRLFGAETVQSPLFQSKRKKPAIRPKRRDRRNDPTDFEID
jgi:hypothetical protein